MHALKTNGAHGELATRRIAPWLLFATMIFTLAACGSEHHHEGIASGSVCSKSSEPDLTYATFGAAFMNRYCVGCHNSQLGNDVPGDLVFESADEVRMTADLIDVHAAAGPEAINTVMPPAGIPEQPTVEERRQLGEWLACGAP